MSYIVEKEWTTQAGLLAVVIIVSVSAVDGKEYKHHRCGYVGIPPSFENLYKVSYDNLDIRCHWGLTYGDPTNREDYPIKTKDNLYWVGFDCSHYEDGHIEYSPWEIENGFVYDYPVRTLEYCEEQCESIASQLTLMQANLNELNAGESDNG